jgi:hypothetical protein
LGSKQCWSAFWALGLPSTLYLNHKGLLVISSLLILWGITEKSRGRLLIDSSLQVLLFSSRKRHLCHGSSTILS